MKTLSLKLPVIPTQVAVGLAVLGGVLQIVQQYAITMSASAHTLIGFALFVLVGVGIVPYTAGKIKTLIPVHLAALLTALAGLLYGVQQLALPVSPVVHSIIMLVLMVLAAIGIRPAVVGIPH